MKIYNMIKASLCIIIKGLLFFGAVGFAQEKNYAPNGEVFTPKGDLRFLVVCADFKGFGAKEAHGDWAYDSDFPNFLNNGSREVFYSDTLDFEAFAKDDSVSNLSKLYYEMSNKDNPFKVVADVFPLKISIHPDSIKGSGWGAVNRAVINEMKYRRPDFNWEPYDQRKNRPDFKFDNSISQPDGKPDYVVILYRYDNSWSVKPKAGVERWLNGAEGASSLSIGTIDYNGFKISSDGFFSFSSTTKNAQSFIGMFKHELGHELFSGPHYMGANEAYGKHFYTPSVGWGSTVCSYHLNETINAWERWLLGWIDIKYDVKEPKKVKCVIGDFATSGDAIRVKIPHSDGQFLWIENHQKRSVFDHNSLKGQLVNSPIGSSGIPDIEAGIYMFVEDMMSDRNSIKKSFVYDMQAVNGVNLVNAQGNYDYEKPSVFTQTTDWSVCWNNKTYHFKRGASNPFSGINPYVAYRHDFDDSGEIKFKHNFNGGDGESVTMVMEIEADTNFLFYGINGGRNLESMAFRRSPAFKHNDELSMVSNPVIVNYPYYNSSEDSISKIHLNGMRIKLKQRKRTDFKVFISFENFKLKQDLRIAGNVGIVKDEFVLKKGSELLVNKSGTVNRRKRIGGGFINPTNFSVSDSGSLTMKPNTSLIITNDSKVEVSRNASLKLKRKSNLFVNSSGSFVCHEGAVLEIHRKSTVEILDEAEIIIEKGTVFNGELILEDLVFTKNNFEDLMRRLGN